jgi:hypothetical protein
MYLEVKKPTAFVSIPVELPDGLSSGRHDLFAVRIDNPGLPVCHAKIVLEGDIYTRITSTYSVRAVIDASFVFFVLLFVLSGSLLAQEHSEGERPETEEASTIHDPAES